MRKIKQKARYFIIAAVMMAFAAIAPAARATDENGNKSFMQKLDWKAEKHFGRATVAEIEQMYGFIEDPILKAYVTKMGNSLTSVSDRTDIPYEFYLVDSDEVNAFAAPGGFIFVTRGLIEKTDTEEELANVMAHEVAHVAKKHGLKQIHQLPLIIVGMSVLQSKAGEKVARIAGAALSLMQLHYSREDEYQADEYGEKYAFSAGYDPDGMITFFEKLRKESPDGNLSNLDVALSSHPKTSNRIARAESAPEMADTLDNKLRLAKSYADRYYFYDAMDKYREALKIDPESAEAQDGLSAAQVALGISPDGAPLLAPVSPELAGDQDREDALASINGAIGRLEANRGETAAEISRVGSSLDSLRRSFMSDLSAFRTIAGRVSSADEARTGVIDGASAYFSGFIEAIQYYREVGERIQDVQNDMLRKARAASYMLGRNDGAKPEAISAALDMTRIINSSLVESSNAFSGLKMDISEIDRSYSSARNAMRDLDTSITTSDQTLDSFTGRQIASTLSEQTNRINAALNDAEDAVRGVETKQTGMLRAELDLNASLMNVSQEEVFKKVTARRFGLQSADLEDLRAEGYGWGDVLLIVDRAAALGKKPKDLVEGYDSSRQTLDDFLAEKEPQRAKGETNKYGFEGAQILLSLAAADLKRTTRIGKLVEMKPSPDPSPDVFAPADLETSDPELAQAIALFKEGKNEDAKKVVDERGRSKPATALSHLVLGLILRAEDNYDSALTEFKYAAKKDNANPAEIMLLTGNTYADTGSYEEAVKEYDSAMKKTPDNPALYADKAYALSMMGRHNEAEGNFNRAISLGSKDYTTYLNLALLYYSEGRIAKSIDAMEKSLALNPDQPLLAEMAENLK